MAFGEEPHIEGHDEHGFGANSSEYREELAKLGGGCEGVALSKGLDQ